ncbi:MAG: hypothetical protein GX571_05910 [Lentisphaerae bacterium]|jgi:hypothetical protein|nr:hypothetical protein [Lentisphaerota bacterium]
MEKLRFLSAGLMAGLFCASLAVAEEAAVPVEKKAKAPGGRDAVFATADTNSDGALSLDEFVAMETKRLEARKARLGDKFDAEKAAKMPAAEARFKKRDQDGNGSLTKEEFFGGAAKVRPERKAKAKVAPTAAPAAAPAAVQ